VYDRVQQFRGDLEYEGAPAVCWTAEKADALLDNWNAARG
jgi:hypothetical protein